MSSVRCQVSGASGIDFLSIDFRISPFKLRLSGSEIESSSTTWHLALDSQHLAPDTWHPAPDASHLVPDTYHLTQLQAPPHHPVQISA